VPDTASETLPLFAAIRPQSNYHWGDLHGCWVESLRNVMTSLAFINDLLSPWHLAIILVFGLLIFGKRLPEVGRGLGRSIVEFKKGLKGIDDDVEEQSSRPRARDPYVEGGYRAPIESNPQSGPQSGPRSERPRSAEPVAPRERMADDPQ